MIFSYKSFKAMFSYGSKILASNLLNAAYTNISVIVVGKVYSSSDLGEFSKANSLSGFPSSTVTGILNSVTFPVLASIQDQKERLRYYYEQFINISVYVVFPIMIGLAAVAKPLVMVLLKEQWIGIVPLFQILCLSSMWNPVQSINLNLLQVLGRSDYFLKLEVYKKIVGLGILMITIPLGIIPMCIGMVVSSLISLFINTYYTKRLIGFGIWDQLRGILHILIHTMVMGAIVSSVVHIVPGTDLIRLIAGVCIGVLYYVSGAHFLRFPEQKEVMSIIADKIRL